MQRRELGVAVVGAGRIGTMRAQLVVPGSLLAEGFRRAGLEFLVNNDALAEGLRRRLLGWRHCGF